MYFREYIKVQDLIANVGGLVKFLFTFTGILMQFYSKNDLVFEISNELFQVNKNEELKPHGVPSGNNVSCLDPSRVNEKSSSLMVFHHAVPKVPALMNANANSLNVSFCDYLKAMVGCRSGYSKKVYNGLNSFIHDKLEVRSIIGSCYKVERLVDILIKKGQIDKKHFGKFTLVESNDKVVIQDVKLDEQIIGIHQ
jgi:hypothetical protein